MRGKLKNGSQMKYTTKTKLFIQTTLDSSECVMLNQGGMHKMVLDHSIFDSEFDEIELSVQIERSQMGRHEFIVKSSADHINSLTEEDKAARERDTMKT